VQAAKPADFRLAARKLKVSYALASSATAQLEADLQTRLFEQTTGTVVLTETGVRYLRDAGRSSKAWTTFSRRSKFRFKAEQYFPHLCVTTL